MMDLEIALAIWFVVLAILSTVMVHVMRRRAVRRTSVRAPSHIELVLGVAPTLALVPNPFEEAPTIVKPRRFPRASTVSARFARPEPANTRDRIAAYIDDALRSTETKRA